ncbi:M23 family metallopeptidase [Paenibacillus roseipurpureus]|uniref:M23 family metallopeptidase n=1 Tax=Paenibacillus roseopurpureus TaxID=2918901 RepID=A0AA96LSQ6_9BACL|nr:M23 family metallopeptidase [Paenibacillus sp. MBLB1832]WNR45851.1 M23 family metallopeptidase [Paenibacillus sp. MBLB1832]
MGSNDKVKQRRLERLRHLRESSDVSQGNGSSFRASTTSSASPPTEFLLPPRPPQDEISLPLYADAEWRRRMEDPEFAWRQKMKMEKGGFDPGNGLFTPPTPRTIALKLLISGMLFAAIYGMFQVNKPWAMKGKLIITEALSRSYDFTAFSTWYTDKFGSSPAFIPSFNRTGNEAVKVSTTSRSLFAPAKGSIIVRYDGSSHKGVNLKTAAFAPVYAVDTGQVIFAGTAAETGQTIVIRHPGGLESTYGGLSEISVAVGDWMKVGEPIGKASAQDPAKGTMYFSVLKEGLSINPADVINFD